MSSGRPDFWYGQVLLFEEEPTDGETSAGPTSNWAYDHENNEDAHHDKYTSTEADAAIATHTADEDAHHAKTASADIDHGAVQGLSDDDHPQYQKESEKDANDGYAGITSGGQVQAPGPGLRLTRDGSDNIYIAERTAVETALYLNRAGANDYDGYIHEGGAYKQILTETHIADEDAHHAKYTDAEAQSAVLPTFIDRGSATSADFDQGDLTQDGSYHDLDLSGIVDSGAEAVFLTVAGQAAAAGDYIFFRKNGITAAYSVSALRGQVANVVIGADIIVGLDGDGVIEYMSPNGDFNTINITVRGWFI